MVERDRDGGDTEPNAARVKVKTAPAPTSFSPGDALQPQFRLNDDNDIDHDGDDEQENVPEDDSERSRSRSHSPAPPTYPPPAAHQQQQHLQSLRQPQPHQQQQQQQQQQQLQQPPPTPTPTPFVAHVHFHSRVRITSGVRRPHGTRSLASANDSSDSDSPSSSISAPLRYRSRDTLSRAPLTERVSRLATQALQKRRVAAVIASSPIASSRRLRARDQEYTPLFRAARLSATYGAAQRRSGNNNNAVDTVTDGADRRRPRIMQSHSEDELAFGRWPWRALNRHVSKTVASSGEPLN